MNLNILICWQSCYPLFFASCLSLCNNLFNDECKVLRVLFLVCIPKGKCEALLWLVLLCRNISFAMWKTASRVTYPPEEFQKCLIEDLQVNGYINSMNWIFITLTAYLCCHSQGQQFCGQLDGWLIKRAAISRVFFRHAYHERNDIDTHSHFKESKE